MSFREQCEITARLASDTSGAWFSFKDVLVTMQLDGNGDTRCFAHVVDPQTNQYHISSPCRPTAREALTELFLLVQDTARIKTELSNTFSNNKVKYNDG